MPQKFKPTRYFQCTPTLILFNSMNWVNQLSPTNPQLQIIRLLDLPKADLTDTISTAPSWWHSIWISRFILTWLVGLAGGYKPVTYLPFPLTCEHDFLVTGPAYLPFSALALTLNMWSMQLRSTLSVDSNSIFSSSVRKMGTSSMPTVLLSLLPGSVSASVCSCKTNSVVVTNEANKQTLPIHLPLISAAPPWFRKLRLPRSYSCQAFHIICIPTSTSQQQQKTSSHLNCASVSHCHSTDLVSPHCCQLRFSFLVFVFI